MTETPTGERSYEYYVELARTTPKISNDDERVVAYLEAVDKGEKVERPRHTQFRDSFHLLFLARKRVDNPKDALADVYLKRAEELGTPWQAFLANNQQLM